MTTSDSPGIIESIAGEEGKGYNVVTNHKQSINSLDFSILLVYNGNKSRMRASEKQDDFKDRRRAN